MKNNFAISYFFLLLFLSFSFVAASQTEPRLVLPIGHTEAINSAVFSPDGKYALTASNDNTARIFEVSSCKEVHILTGHKEDIKSAVFSPDGKYALTASCDSTARIYDVVSGKEVHILAGHTNSVNSAVFSPDGKLVLTASGDNTARIYEVCSGKELQVLSGHAANVNSAVFSLDGKLALMGSGDSTARIYDVSTGKELQVLSGHTRSIVLTVFSPDGKLVLTAGDTTARIYEVSTGKELQVLRGHTRSIFSAVFSPNGKFALTASADNTARIYEVCTGKELQVLRGHTMWVVSAVYSPDGKYALTASDDNTARIYEVSTGRELQVLNGHSNLVVSAVYSPDGKYALTASDDNTARIYEVSTGQELHVLSGHTDEVTSAYYSPNGKMALTASWNNTARIYEVCTGKEMQVLSGHTDIVTSAVFSLDGKLAITAGGDDNTARIYEVSTGQELQVLSGNTAYVTSAVFSPDGKLALTARSDSTARIYEVCSGKELQVLSGHAANVNSAVFSPDGKLALTASWDNTARIYEVGTCKELQVLSGHSNWVYSAVFSLDGKMALTASHDSTARIYDVSTGQELHVLSGHKNVVTSAVFSPDGKLALTASRDNTARIYEVGSGKELQVLNGHANRLTSAVFNRDGKLALTTSDDATALIYEVSSGKEIHLLRGHSARINSCSFSSDDKYIITTGADHKTILWETATGKSLYTRLQLKDNDWLVYDEHYRFDGTPGAIEKLYFTCGLEVIDLAQMKDSLWVPGLVEKIMSGQDILINDKTAPKLSELNICDLTPVIEPIEQEDKKILKYRITPRNGGLGNTEVYINGNLTYALSPKQLRKSKEDGKDVYYLTLSTDTLQQYLTGKKNDENPILVKSKVKGSGIYGRGVSLELEKNTDEDPPQFYGVFVGVNDYGNPQKTANETRYRNLDYAAKDANDLSLAVEKTAANLFKSDAHIYRLTGTGNEAPTKENLQRILAEIGAKSKASDILYIFFAGHGDIKKGKNEEGQDQDQIRFMLMNADKTNPFSTSFGVEELTKWCSPQKIKAQKRVFVFDACHSGKIIDQTMAFNGRGDDEGARIRQLDKLKDKNGMMILAAAADDESAYEDETLNQGVLTYHLLQVMKEQSDTSLVVRNWFDETIELVKDYSKANGNKQEPSSFGDGRFEIGNVNQDVREAIQITCPKTRVGASVFVDPTGEAEVLYPGLQEKINNHFSGNSRGDLVFSSNTDKSYRATGTYFLSDGKLLIRYKIFQGGEQMGGPISIQSKRYKNENEVVQAITNSIAQEIEKLRIQDEKCKLSKN